MGAERQDKGHESPVIHEYDGIEECDNQLPRWWLWTFYGTIVFAIGYWFYFHTSQSGVHPLAEHDAQEAATKAAEAERAARAAPVTVESLLAASKEPTTLKEGKEVFMTTCVACHLASGGGGIGPNLTDEFWIHGGAPDKIYQVIRDGVPLKGMASWGPSLGEGRVRAVTAYVVSIKGSNVAGGKPPQGDKEDP